MSIPAAILQAIVALPNLIKGHKDYKLGKWVAPTKSWITQHDKPMSARQCKKLKATYVSYGEDPRLFVIVRWSAKYPANGPNLEGAPR